MDALAAAREAPSLDEAAAALVPPPREAFRRISPPPSDARLESSGEKQVTAVCGPALSVRADGACGRARAITLAMPHGVVETPVFMPVGTHGTVKGLTSEELAEDLDCKILLSNTYHLGVRPGGDTLEALGGLHSLMRWPRNILTDSGGFQMVSLLHLAEITEAGVKFRSPSDGSEMLLTPEASMKLQNQIGSDIMMALDDVVDSKTVNAARFREACERTLRWIDRCVAANARPKEQNLFAIVQGGLDVEPGGLRELCLHGLLERDEHLPGYAIGGLAGGEDKNRFWRVVAHSCSALPSHKPRYLMGVGYPLDLVVCVALGVDMFDCVFPTRTARFGVALVSRGQLKLKAAGFAQDPRPIDDACSCSVCRRYSRAQLHALLRAPDGVGPQLVSHHNIAYMLALGKQMRAAITGGSYQSFVRWFLSQYFPPHDPAAAPVPYWVADALAHAGVDIGSDLFDRLRSSTAPRDVDTADLPVVPPDWKTDASSASSSSGTAVASSSGAEKSTQ
jgi:queuine tRNA-ribosyltransferase catalytic subunit